MSLGCFVVTLANTMDRLQLSMGGVPATIERASKTQIAPTDWSLYEDQLHALFLVKVKTKDGKESSANLFLTKEVVAALLNGQQGRIIFAKDNPRRFLMHGDPLPPFGIGWFVTGLLFFAGFLYSLRLR